MSATPASTFANPEQLVADLQNQLAEREAQLAEAQRNLTEATTERHEALAREAATTEVLGVINSSPGDLKPVFDAILDKAMRLCEAAFGHLDIYDGERFETIAMKNAPAAFAEFRIKNPPNYGAGTGPARMLAGERVFQHLDVKKEDAYRHGEPNRRALVDLGGARSVLQVALAKEQALLGFITLFRQEVRPFTDNQIALMQNFAAQAVIAMENARLITETREALEQQTATAEVLQVINSSPGDLAPVFDAMLEKATTLCDASFGIMWGYEGDLTRVLATYRVPQAFIDFTRQPFEASSDSGPGHVRRGGGVRSIDDITAWQPYLNGDPLPRAMGDLAGARSGVIAPLRKDVSVLGAITVYRQEVRPFTGKQIALLQNFAAQAVIAMENARLITEAREALEQQTATAEVLGVINASPGDLAPVFDAMLEKATRLCEAAFGVLWTHEDDSFRAAALRGVPPAYAEFVAREPRGSRPGGALGRLARGEPLVHIPDTSASGAQRDEMASTLVELGGIRTLVAVPLRKDGALLGAFTIYRQEVRPFSDKQIGLLQNFAAQAVIAMENARLITETREALEQQTATAEVLGVINSSPGDLAPVFDAMLERALRLCGATFGMLTVQEGERLLRRAARNLPPAFAEYLAKEPLDTGQRTFVGRALREGAVIHVADILTEEPYRQGVPLAVATYELAGARTMLWVPLVKDNSALGIFTIYRTEVRPFSEKEIALLQNFAAQAVIAMENARLITETREALEQQTATAEVLGVINASPGDLAPVFDALLERARAVCGFARGSLNVFDGNHFRTVATHGIPEKFAELLRQPRRGGPQEGFLSGEDIVHTLDIMAAQNASDDPVYRAAINVGGVRTVLMVPLRKDKTLLGYLTASREEVRPFSDKQIALLQNFAAQAVIAMENARLLGELRQRTEEVAELNRDLEARVAGQVEELGRVGRLKRFLAPQLAELIVSQGDEKILESHRREIVVVFCDLRGYTAFTETAEPEEVLDFLREYHGALGPLVSQFEGTLDQFSGDGIMVFFNDPVPIPDPAERAVRMAVAMREAAAALMAVWRRRGRALGFGAGIAQGYATLGQIGFSERSGYTAIGTVCNVAARLCAEAKDGQILLSQRVAAGLDGSVGLEEIGPIALKGLTQPIVAYNVPLAAGASDQTPFRVIEGGGPPSA